MQIDYVVFRYQADLAKDEWIPLGIVADCREQGQACLAAICIKSVDVGGVSDLAAAMLDDIPAILHHEVNGTLASLLPGQGFLEALRARNPWNVHFSEPKQIVAQDRDPESAAMQLFYEILSQQTPRRRATASHPRQMEAFTVPVDGHDLCGV